MMTSKKNKKTFFHNLQSLKEDTLLKEEYVILKSRNYSCFDITL